jgi:hypothetical protein
MKVQVKGDDRLSRARLFRGVEDFRVVSGPSRLCPAGPLTLVPPGASCARVQEAVPVVHVAFAFHSCFPLWKCASGGQEGQGDVRAHKSPWLSPGIQRRVDVEGCETFGETIVHGGHVLFGLRGGIPPQRSLAPQAAAMPKNKGKGGKSFRSGKKDRDDSRRPLVLKKDFENPDDKDAPPVSK